MIEETHSSLRHLQRLNFSTWLGALVIILLAFGGIRDMLARKAEAVKDLQILDSLKVQPLAVYNVPGGLGTAFDWVTFSGELPQDAFAFVSITFVIEGRQFNSRYFTVTGHDIINKAAFPVMPEDARSLYGDAQIQVKFVYHGHERNYGEVSIDLGGEQ